MDDAPQLRKQWFENYKDITNGVPEVLPPLREVNHRIPIIDSSKVYHYHLPRCPDAMKPALMEKLRRYNRAGWWKFKTAPQAAPMLCIAKKTGDLRTVFDLRKRNDNTVKDVSPFPDQEQIRQDVARAAVRSKIDLSDAYEQVRIVPEDVEKTAFSTVYGTMVSLVMQQGDCNAPATFQRLMVHVFREHIGTFMHAYLDDLFIFSDSVEEHEKHLGTVFELLRSAKLYLKSTKCDLYSERMDCLGHMIDHRGLHADDDKMARVREWRTPRDFHDVQRFLGLVQYLAHFMPNVSAYTGPLSGMMKNGRAFQWRPIHQRCLDMIKHLACAAPILRPIDPKVPEPIWVICDASASGVGAVYGQGPSWETCRPAGFMSRKFTAAQHAYRVFELETIAILEALLRWEDKLLGRKIIIVTDHRALEFFKTQPRLSNRQTRWMEFMSRFDYDIQYVKGETNLVADCLSRYFSNDTADETHDKRYYVNADVRLDPEGEDLPLNRASELRAMDTIDVRRSSRTYKPTWKIREGAHDHGRAGTMREASALEERRVEAQAMASASPTPDPMVTEHEVIANDYDRLSNTEGFMDRVKAGYAEDVTFSKILSNPSQFAAFEFVDGLLWTTSRAGGRVLCVPRVKFDKRSLIGTVLEQAHTSLGHFGYQKTADYVRRWYWWPTVGKDTKAFCSSCGVCQATKTSNQPVAGLLHSLPVPSRPWGSIAMDFIGPFPRSGEHDYLWVVLCRLTSLVHLVPISTTTTANQLAWLYVKEIVKLHGIADSIVSDRDTKFTSRFWTEVHRLLGTRLLMSTAFHPQTDGATERANRSIGQILRAAVAPDQRDWVDRLPMVEFAINSSISSSTGFAPFELTYGILPRMVTGLETGTVAPGVEKFAKLALENLSHAHDAIIESRVSQTYHANKARRDEHEVGGIHHPMKVGDLVYLSTKNLSIPKGRARKLVHKFIGPYRVTACRADKSVYTLDLPEDLKRRGIHPTFHVSLLRRHEPNDDSMFPHRETRVLYDIGVPENTEWLVDEILAHEWVGRKIRFLVKWNQGEAGWEPRETCDELEALDSYLALAGVATVEELPRRRIAGSRTDHGDRRD